MKKYEDTIIYMVQVRDDRQNELIATFMQTFSDTYTCDIDRLRFPIGTMYCYIMINDKFNEASLVIQNKPSNEPIDVELVIYQDIITIPLMHSAIKASRMQDS